VAVVTSAGALPTGSALTENLSPLQRLGPTRRWHPAYPGAPGRSAVLAGTETLASGAFRVLLKTQPPSGRVSRPWPRVPVNVWTRLAPPVYHGEPHLH
jgi:hypothetical protein